MRATLDRAELERFRRAVTGRLGLQFDDGKLDLLAEVAAKRLDALGLAGLDPYLLRLEAGDPDEEGVLAQQLTVGETYFFRNENDLRAFAAAVVPDRIRARGGEKRLRFLSAGCASGEEPYTLAMLLRQIPGLAGWDLAVRGLDLNPAAIARARAARYGEWSLRQTPAELRARFFLQEGRELRVSDEVRALVEFERRNLAERDPEPFPPGAWDAIFCRNVTMYFAPEVTRRVVDRIASSLAPGGFLFLGHAETLRGVSSRFHLRQTHGTFYYQLREGAAPAASPAPRPASAPRPAPEPNPAPAGDGSWLLAIQEATARIAALIGKPSPKPAVPPPGASLAPVEVARALDLLRRERFGDALAELGAAPLEDERDGDVLLLRAVLLSSGGRHAEAEEVCGRLLALDELSSEAHYLMALCREHAGDTAGAADQDRYALYLDPTFAMPRLHLGLMARRAGDAEAARRELSRARVLLAAEEASRILLLGGGFSREALVALCRAELRACGGEP